MSGLIDTNVLFYLYDPRNPRKQAVARRLVRSGTAAEELVIPHQAVVEFVAAASRPRRALAGGPLLDRAQALREAETLMTLLPVLYPDPAVLRTALRGAATYQLSWFDAHLWAYAEVHGLDEVLSEDFEHGRRYGTVRARDPFLEAADAVHELPALYAS